MITCQECIDRLGPDDPRIRSGRYMKCGCDYCDKPDYYRDLEVLNQQPSEQTIIHRYSNMGRQEFDLLQQTVLKAEYLAQKLTEHIEASKKRKGKY